MGTSRRKPLLRVLLLAVAFLGGAAWVLLRETPTTAPLSPGAGPAPGVVLPGGDSTGPRAPGGDTAPAGTSTAALATGVLVLPRAPGTAPVEARLTVLREGLPVAGARSGPGPFSLPYERAPDDAAPWRLRAAAPGRSPVEVPLPAPRTDAGEIRLYAGICYSGVAVDDRGVPEEGVTMHLLVDGYENAASEPTDADGGFRIPLPSGTRLQGFFQEEEPRWGARPALEPRAPGRLFVPTRALAEGLAGVHRVVLDERPVGIRLRFTEGAAGLPVAGASVSLWPAADVFSFSPPAPADAGRTDAAGVYAPRWPMGLQWAAVRIAAPPGRVSWTLLERSFAEGTEPRDLVLPAEPVVIRASCVLGETGTPVAGAFVVLTTNAGYPFWGTSDARGELEWRLFESDSFDPGPLAIGGWTAAWRDAGGALRMDRGGDCGGEALAVVPAAGERAALRLGGTGAPGLWIAVRGEGVGPLARPTFVMGNPAGKDPARDGWAVSFAGFRGPAGADARGTLWWSYDYMDGDWSYSPLEGQPPGTPLVLELRTVDAPVVFLESTLGALTAARASGAALVFDLRPPEVMTRTVRVVDGEGRPRPGALVAVVAIDPGIGWPRETERVAADREGRAVLQTLDPAGGSRVVAWDPADGACGAVAGVGEDAPEGAWTVRVEGPREFRMRIRMADGGAPRWPFASLAPLSTMLPPLQGRVDGDGNVSAEGVAVRGYGVYLNAADGKGKRHSRTGPAADLEGTEVVLGGEPTPASGR